MSTLYIAANGCRELRYALGDTVTIVKAADLFAETTPHDRLLLSLHADEPLNLLWEAFIARWNAVVLWDRWDRRTPAAQFAALDERRRTRTVHGVSFDAYRELYPRLDGPHRWAALRGPEYVDVARNIFEYYLFGQEEVPETPPNSSTTLQPGLIGPSGIERRGDRSVFVAPYEHCQGNRVFTIEFWEAVCDRLLAAGVSVTANALDGFHPRRRDPRLKRTFLPYDELIPQIASERLVLCGNTGVGWVAAAAGTPLLAMEGDIHLPEYGFARCGVASLVGVIDEPDPDRAVEAALDLLDAERPRAGP